MAFCFMSLLLSLRLVSFTVALRPERRMVWRPRKPSKNALFGKVGYEMVQDGSSKGGFTSVNDDGKVVPVAAMVESIIGCKWSMRLLALLADDRIRPSAILRTCPGLSAKVLNERLRKMMRFGIVRRSVFGEKPPLEVEYALTSFGRRFLGILDEVRHLQDALDSGAIAEPDESRGKPARRGRPARRVT